MGLILPGEAVAVGVAFLIYFAVLLFSLALLIAMYLFFGIGLHKMGKTLGIEKSWMAFVPYASSYLMGKIAECAPVSEGKKRRKYSSLLLWWNIIVTAVYVVGCVGILIAAVVSGMAVSATETTEAVAMAPIALILICLIWAMVLFAIAIVSSVYFYMALHKIYKIFSPDNAVAFTVVSIVVPFFTGITAHPIIVFAIRNKTPVLEERNV